MYRSFIFALVLSSVGVFGGYAYFTTSTMLELPKAVISFSASDLDRVVLSVYRLNMDPVELFTKSNPTYESLRERAGRRVLQKAFTLTQKWQRFSTEFENAGLYLAVLSSTDQNIIYDSTVLIVTDLGLVFLTDQEKTVLCTMKTTSEIAPDVELFLLRDGKIIFKSKTNEYGLAEFKEDFDMVIAKKDNSYAVSYLYKPYGSESVDMKLFLTTDRPIYKPKDTVNFKGQLLKRNQDIYTVLGATKVQVTISDPKGNEIYSKSLTTDELGGFWDSFKLAETAAVGVYRVEVLHEADRFFESFLVEEYRKPEYKVEIETNKEEYISGENIQATIKVRYFNELPVTAANVAFYVHAYSELTNESSLEYRGYEITDENGELRISLKTEEGFQGRYSIQAIVTDESQRQIEQEKKVDIYADNVVILLDRDWIWTKPGEKLSIKAKVTDLQGNPLNGEMTVKVGTKISKTAVTNGHALVEFSPQAIGSYKIELSFQKAKKYVYVYSYAWVQGYTVSEFALITDKESCKPGEQVSVQIFSPDKTVGVIALVGDQIYSAQTVKIQGHSTLNLFVPKIATERNLFIVFAAYSSGKRITDTKTIKLDRQFNVQRIQIHFDKEVYQPKDEARLILKSDEDFSFSLALVDEAIYSMLGTKPISIEEKLYPFNEYPGIVWDFANFWYYLAQRRFYELASMPEEKNFEDFKKNAVEAKINVREYFPDTALWIPNLRTENGQATVVFKIPDSLTTFIATAYGFSKKNIAQADGKFVVTRDFYVRPILPTFFREGDIVQISATVFNQTPDDLKTNVWLQLPDSVELVPMGRPQIDSFSPLPITEDTQTTIYVPSKGTNSTSWVVHALKESDPSTITTFATSSDGLADAVALNIPVKPFAFEREFYTLEFVNGLKIVNLPTGQYKRASLTVYSSIVPLVENSIRKLIHYPYGCTEQTMSSFFPAVVAAQMGLKIDDLEDIVQKGLMRLYKYQHSDGGWGWWQNDESKDFMTCYVMEGLFYAKKAGFEIAESVIKAGLNYLSENLSAYGSYVLDLYGVQHEPYQAKNESDWVYLSLSSKEAFEKAVGLMKQVGTFAFIDAGDWFTTKVQLNSILLRSFNKWNQHTELQSKLINYLLSEKDGYFWYSTKDTAFAVLALLETLPRIGEPHVVVKNNGRTVELSGQGQIEIEQADLKIEGNALVEVHVVYYERPSRAVNEGINVQRRFYKRYEVPVIDQKTVVDAFIPISQHYVPVSVKIIDETKPDELYILPYETGDYTYRNTKLKIEDNKLTMNGSTYEFERIQTLNGMILILLVNKSVMVYDTSLKTAKVYFDVQDANLMEKGLAYLKEGTLWINDQLVIKVPEDVVGLSCSKSEILLRSSDKTYWFKDGNFVELPFVAEDTLYWDGKKIIAQGGFRFSGNETTLTSQLCEVVFTEETWPISISSGDIVKTVITLVSGTGSYIVVEDYFPSCAQVLDRYREKSLRDYSKFDYMWYRSWDRWFTASELHEDRIAFFALDYSSQSLSYFWRVTSNGRYQILPARAYSMYYKGTYGHSDPDVLDIGVWFEVEKSK
ncbi:MAG TPA: MG2 domain-containing protein [Pseudothermotoga sp.]|nr:MG2 domain-containing protein [Pseudothermotoga sp.]HOK84327.1 MG2 domain-containing protein [Pseudothermotoga sp.]HPP70739.1 MG2 domain-containing protein [Pseudothermotoga sp.]